jgi:hypothetical protein
MTNVCWSYRHLRQIMNSYAQQVRHFHAYAKIKNKFLPISIYLCLTIGVNQKKNTIYASYCRQQEKNCNKMALCKRPLYLVRLCPVNIICTFQPANKNDYFILSHVRPTYCLNVECCDKR